MRGRGKIIIIIDRACMWPANTEILLSSPLEKKFANPWPRMWMAPTRLNKYLKEKNEYSKTHL